jgi:hypothetical protein
MSSEQKLERLLLEIEAAKMRYEWAAAEALEHGRTPELTRVFEESIVEYLALQGKLHQLNQPAQSAMSGTSSADRQNKKVGNYPDIATV